MNSKVAIILDFCYSLISWPSLESRERDMNTKFESDWFRFHGPWIARTVVVVLATILIMSSKANAEPEASLPPVDQLPAWADSMFSKPFVDVDEWRDEPVRHRYVHGGFKGTETRFSMYFQGAIGRAIL